MFSFTIARLASLFLIALFSLQVTATAIQSPNGANALAARAAPPVSCAEYATLSNLTAIGTNSTFRGAFIQSSPDGTRQSSAILDNAIKKWTSLALINDTALNKECGNLSAVALTEAPKNFTQGKVGPFKIGAAARLGSGVGFTAIVTAAMVGAAMMSL